MGRFSPTVLPNSGEVLSRALGQGVESFMRARRQRDEDQRLAKANERQSVLDAEGKRHNQAMEGMAAFQHGFVRDDMKGIDRRTALTGGQVNDAMSVATGGVTGPALSAALGRPDVQTSRYGPSVGGYSYDEESDAAQNARVARALSISQTEKNLREPVQKPTAQGHVVDPVTGEVKFFDPTSPPSGLRVNPAPHPASYTPVTLGGENGTPAVVRPFNNRTGEVGASVGPAKPATPLIGRQPTEIQSRARLVVPRAEAAAAELERFFTSGAPVKSEMGKVPLVGNFVLNKDEQMMNQAAETIASSILRLESGANYTKNEMLSYKKQFLPAPGDSPEVLAQKRATLQEQLRSMRELADRGPAGRQSPPTSSPLPSAPARPSAGDPESAWAAKNPPHPGESFEQYHARYLAGAH